MVDEFMVCVDRLIPSTTFSPENGVVVSSGEPSSDPTGGSGLKGRRVLGSGGFGNIPSDEMDLVEEGERCSEKMESRECRICQEEGEEKDMESPCACNGTLKFAHRMCIQKWCNKKGSITCEICNQVYAPNYSIPLCRTHLDVFTVDIRQSWGEQMVLHDPRFLALTSAEQELVNGEIDGYSTAHNNGIACCRYIALILMLLILIQHAFAVVRETTILLDATTLLNVPFLHLAIIFLPCYIISRLCFLVRSRRQRHVNPRQAWG